MAVGAVLPPRTFINVFLKNILFGKYHTWFLATLIGLYFITPFLYKIVADKRLTHYFLLLSVSFTVFLPYVGKVGELSRAYEVIQEIHMNFVVGYVLFYVAGFWLSQIKITDRLKAGTVLAFLASSLLGFGSSIVYSGSLGQDCQQLYSEFSVFGFIMCTSAFLLFRVCFEHVPCEKAAVVMKLRSCGMGIYLVHPLVLSFLPEACFPGLSAVGKAVLVWCCAVILAASAGWIGRKFARDSNN